MHAQRSVSYGTALAILLLLLMLLAPTSARADSTVVVRGDTAAGENQPGWLFNRDQSTSTPFEFTTEEASIGGGSVYVLPIGGVNRFDKFIAEYFLLDEVDDFEEISYDFLIGGNGTPADANDFYLNVYTNLPGQDVDNFYDCRFDYVPAVYEGDWTTMTVDKATAPANVRSRGGATCQATLGALPEGSTIRAFAINVGDTSTSDSGLAGYLDKVVLTYADETTTFDFEAPPETKNDCKKGGWADYGFGNQGQCVSFVATGGKKA